MTLEQLKAEIQKYQYLEDTNLIDVALASIISSRLGLGSPVWLILIGASSGGKSQILRPLALTDPSFLFRVDDLTENTFLSGLKTKEGEVSLLKRIGQKGMIVVSDLTVLFSKQAESRATILSQFRMIYDGEMTKFSGSSTQPITWKGHLGVIAGSTPSIYHHFEEVADMGERFIYYRMKEYDPHKATRLALSRQKYGRVLDDMLGELYGDYLKDVIKGYDGAEVPIGDETIDRIIDISTFAEKIRTVAHKDRWKEVIDRKPIPAMPMRVALQLMAVAKGLMILKRHEDKGAMALSEREMSILDWCGYSLANEEKRAVLYALALVPADVTLSTSDLGDAIGLSTSVVNTICQNLSAVGVLERSGDMNTLRWKFKKESDHQLVRRIEGVQGFKEIISRDIVVEEGVIDTAEIDF